MTIGHYIISATVSGIIAGFINQYKNRRFSLGFLGGFLTGIIGIVYCICQKSQSVKPRRKAIDIIVDILIGIFGVIVAFISIFSVFAIMFESAQ